jgi:hypothetical protein
VAADETIRVRILGLDAIDDAFDRMISDLHAELRPGFVPQHRYHGLGGIPFATEATETAARRNGFVIRGEGW